MCLLIFIHEWIITLLSHHFYLMLLTRSFLYQPINLCVSIPKTMFVWRVFCISKIWLTRKRCHSFIYIYIFVDFREVGRERGGGKERGIDDGRESFIVWLPPVCPTLGVGPPTWECTLIGELNHDLFLVHRLMLNPWATPARWDAIP